MKKGLKVFGFLVIIIIVLIGIAFASMSKKTQEALNKQENVEIDMTKVKDGTYNGSSDGGMVKVEVAVEVENHQIKNIELIPNPSQTEMDALICHAQINVLITFQATGLKLKLLNTLYNGRWMLVNPEMLAGTGLESLCEIAGDAAEMKQKIISLLNTEYDQNQLLARAELLQKRFSDEQNARRLIKEVWG